MASSGDQHGGNGKTAKEIQEMQDKYVEARINGHTVKESTEIAGYGSGVQANKIERLGGQVHNKMVRALADRGITEESIASEYVKGIEESKKSGAKERDLNAHVQYLKQLGYLLGYHKQGPQVAVQINNTQQAPEFDPSRIGELVNEVSGLIEFLQEEISSRKSGGVHEGDIRTQDTAAHPGVVDATTEAQAPSGGGQS